MIESIKTCSLQSTQEENLLHMEVGIVSEVGEILDAIKRHRFYKKEFNRINFIEEVGDLCWYISGFLYFSNYRLSDIESTELSLDSRTIETLTEHNMVRSLMSALSRNITLSSVRNVYLASIIPSLCKYVDITIEEVLDLNTKKLQDKINGRYKAGVFTSEESVNRDLEKERRILESIDKVQMIETLDEYQQLATKKLKFPAIHNDLYLISLLSEESGEVSKLFRKRIEEHKIVEIDELSLELGDVLWTITTLAKSYNLTLLKVAQDNLQKLKERGLLHD
jgi:NTP pyrophosphatase (non-canonical NTP hydrolase)